MYCEGLGCKKDYKKAKKYFESAAAQGNIEALYNIGYLYQNGFGVKVDMDKAVEYYEKSAAKGYELASHAINNINMHRDFKETKCPGDVLANMIGELF
jgi:TPR repeat protein